MLDMQDLCFQKVFAKPYVCEEQWLVHVYACCAYVFCKSFCFKNLYYNNFMFQKFLRCGSCYVVLVCNGICAFASVVML